MYQFRRTRSNFRYFEIRLNQTLFVNIRCAPDVYNTITRHLHFAPLQDTCTPCLQKKQWDSVGLSHGVKRSCKVLIVRRECDI